MRAAVWAIARHLVYVPIVVWAKVMRLDLSGFMHDCVNPSSQHHTWFARLVQVLGFVWLKVRMQAQSGHLGLALAAITQPDNSRVHARPCRPCRLRHSIVTPASVCTGSNGSRIDAGFMSVCSSRTGQLSLLFYHIRFANEDVRYCNVGATCSIICPFPPKFIYLVVL